MRRSFLVLVIAVLLLVRAPVHAQDLLIGLFGDYVESLRRQAGIPGLAAAIVKGNDVLWERAFGQQDLERSIAARTDTPFHLDGLTQVFTASLVLRCVEEGRLSLDDRVGQFTPDSPDANATIRQILTHTSGPADNLIFSYNSKRLDPLAFALSACTGDSSREMLAKLLDRLAMIDSVPGPDAVDMVPPYEGVTSSAIARYTGVLRRLATPYAVDNRGRASPSRYVATTLTSSSGLISTVRDLEQFDLALRKGVLLRGETLVAAWRPPVGRDGQSLPHGLGWFVQMYNGKLIVWQFGVNPNASSSLMVTVPSRGLTLILLANSDGLAKPFALAAGDLTASPFARVFLGTLVR